MLGIEEKRLAEKKSVQYRRQMLSREKNVNSREEKTTRQTTIVHIRALPNIQYLR